MSSNLDKFFKMDTNCEKNGVWFEIAGGAEFLVRRFGGANTEMKKCLAKYYKPFAKLIDKGLLDDAKERSLYTKAFVEACIVDWKGVEIDGAIAEYSSDAAVKLFKELPDLLDFLVEQSQSEDNFKEDLGNS